MKGNNELHLNTATMIEALQYWLDHVMLQNTPTVTGVKSESGSHGIFIVNVSGEADRPGPRES